MNVSGEVRVPGDKSISHRALMLATLATGRSRVRGILRSADVSSTAGVLRGLGAAIPALGAELAIDGLGLRGMHAPVSPLDCGNSGTTARLMAGIVAAQPFSATFVGDESLMRRPMRRIQRPLERMGARIELTEKGTLPMVVHGAELGVVDWDTGTASAQVKSAILLAAVVAGTRATVHEPVRSRDHTERMLTAMGATVKQRETSVAIAPVQSLQPLDLDVPGDPSSAAFLVALAALAEHGSLSLPGVCVNPTRTGFLDVIREMGARVELRDAQAWSGEDVATVIARPGALRGVTVGGPRVPAMIDELPLLACLAAVAEGETVITGAAELRAKESDRIAAVVSNLRTVGAEAEELPDGMRIAGGAGRLAGRVATHRDHRIAMAFGVLAALPGNAIEIDDPACVAVSYPGFWNDVRRVTGG